MRTAKCNRYFLLVVLYAVRLFEYNPLSFRPVIQESLLDFPSRANKVTFYLSCLRIELYKVSRFLGRFPYLYASYSEDMDYPYLTFISSAHAEYLWFWVFLVVFPANAP